MTERGGSNSSGIAAARAQPLAVVLVLVIDGRVRPSVEGETEGKTRTNRLDADSDGDEGRSVEEAPRAV